MYRLQKMRRSQSPTGYSLRQFETTKSIFIHIPKASGVSVAQSLYGNMGCGHLAMREYELAFGPRFIGDSFIFTFVRNPWDRLHSAYRFLAKGGMNRADAQWLAVHQHNLRSFESFVIDGLHVPAIASSIHVVPQTQFLYSPVYGYDAIDFIGLFENLDHDFRVVCDSIGAMGATLTHENRTSGSKEDYRRAYTDTMREAAGTFYGKDIDLLGYDFEGLALKHQLAARSDQRFEYLERPGGNPRLQNG
jgi:hypothetical protein